MEKHDASTASSTAAPAAARRFARLELRHVLGKGQASTTWLAHDPGLGCEVLLCLPRAQPVQVADREAWMQAVTSGGRLKHPRLAPVLEHGVHNGWPFVVCERGNAVTLQERVQPGGRPLTVLEVVNVCVEILEGLAYAHDAGVSHRDLALHNVLVSPAGRVTVAGLGVAWASDRDRQSASAGAWLPGHSQASAERDVLMVGLLMHRLLAGHPALDDPDLHSAASRVGPEIVLLPRSGALAVPDTLRAIVNRATDRQPRQRYLNGRTLIQALQGWLKVNGAESVGPLALIMDRLNTVGHLPSRHKHLQRLQNELMQDTLRVDDMSDLLVQDPALVFELLRMMHSARVAGSLEEPTCSLSRSIAMLGIRGVRRLLQSVRTWPGVLEAQASLHGEQAGQQATERLAKQLQLAAVAALTARWLRPFNVGDEEVMVATMAQRLGWLLILYHFPEEASQIDRLMNPEPSAAVSEAPQHGMARSAATGAVLGVDPDDLTAAVLKFWGFGEGFIQAARPWAVTENPLRPHATDDWLRITASLANELVTLIGKGGVVQQRQLAAIVSRYSRATVTSQKEMVEALQRAIAQVDGGSDRRTAGAGTGGEPGSGSEPGPGPGQPGKASPGASPSSTVAA